MKLALSLAIASTASVASIAQAVPFQWETAPGSGVLVGATSVAGRTMESVVASPFAGETDVLFTVFAGGSSGTNQGAQKSALNRNGLGKIISGTNTWSMTGSGLGWKSVDIYDNDTLYHTVEEGGGDTDGTLNIIQDASLGTAPVGGSVVVVDLTNQRTGFAGVGTSGEFDPEGMAINRATNTLYALTDDGPNADINAYNINPTTKALTSKWTASHPFQLGATAGNDAIILPDGRVAVMAGEGTVNLYAVTDNGTSGSSVNLLGGSVTRAGDIPQDLLATGGYLYLLWDSGMMDAFDLSALSNTPVASINLDTVIGATTYRGMDVTQNGELLVTTTGGSGTFDSRVFALNTVPEPTTLAALAGAGSLILRRRRA